MKILQICHRIPYPAIDGGNIAMMNMAHAIIEAGNEVHQFALNTKKHFVNPLILPEELRNTLHFNSVIIDTKISAFGIIKNLFFSESYNIVRFYSKAVEKELENVLQENTFDVIQLETLFTAPYIECIRKNSTAKIVLRAHNVEHIIWERLAMEEKNIFRKNYLTFLAKRLKKYETETLKNIDAIMAITSVDENLFRQLAFKGMMITVPVSLDFKEYDFDAKQETEMTLFHLGSMDWMPNLEAVDWFLKRCWPKLNSIFPSLKLYLAGRSFPQEIIDANYPNVICEGRIEDAHLYMRKKQIMVVPLLSGSGMRVKIIQGMALGKTIISTRIGAEGIPVENGKNIFFADTPEEFIEAISYCIYNPNSCKQTGINGRKFVEDNYSNQAAGKRLDIFYRELSNKHKVLND